MCAFHAAHFMRRILCGVLGSGAHAAADAMALHLPDVCNIFLRFHAISLPVRDEVPAKLRQSFGNQVVVRETAGPKNSTAWLGVEFLSFQQRGEVFTKPLPVLCPGLTWVWSNKVYEVIVVGPVARPTGERSRGSIAPHSGRPRTASLPLNPLEGLD